MYVDIHTLQEILSSSGILESERMPSDGKVEDLSGFTTGMITHEVWLWRSSLSVLGGYQLTGARHIANRSLILFCERKPGRFSSFPWLEMIMFSHPL